MSESMNFDELWEHQQGAIFLKKDHIYDNRKDLAEFFFRHGEEQSNAEIKDLEAKQEMILEYCRNNTHLMWAAQIVSIVFDCDFRDAEHMMMKRGAK